MCVNIVLHSLNCFNMLIYFCSPPYAHIILKNKKSFLDLICYPPPLYILYSFFFKILFSSFFYNFVNKNRGIEKCTPKMDGVPQNLYTLQGIRPHGYIVLYLAYRSNYLFPFFFRFIFSRYCCRYFFID